MLNHYFLIIIACLHVSTSKAQENSREEWNSRNIVALKASELYAEANIGVKVNKSKERADFLYISLGYGKPSRTNPWKNFLPTIPMTEDMSPSELEVLRNLNTNSVHAGMIGLGWNHWFNHTFGCYASVGWGFMADFSSDPESIRLLMAKVGKQDKSLFIYNTAPVEAGITLNVLKQWTLSGGVTYMWKEVPTFTFGIGYIF